MRNETRQKASRLIEFTRGGQIFRNEATMFKQNVAFVLGTLVFCLVIFPFVWFAIVTTDTQLNSFFLDWVHKFYDAIGLTGRHHIKVLTYEGPIVTTLAERYTVPGYSELLKEVHKLARNAWLTGGVLTFVVIGTYFYITKTIGKSVIKDKHLRGMSVGTYDNMKKEVIKYNKKEAIKYGIEHDTGYNINQIPYPLMAETMHTLLVGSTGAGKTNFLTYLLDQIKAKGDRAVVIDKMCSFSGKYYNPETDHIMNLVDKRNSAWDIFKDVEDLTEWNNIAEILIESPDKGDSYFVDGARTVFSLTGYLYTERQRQQKKAPSISGLYDLMIKSTNEDFYEFLLGTEAAIHVHPNSKGQTNGIRGTLSNAMSSFSFLHDVEEDKKSISIKDWMKNDDNNGVCFLTSRADKHPTLRPIITTWTKLFITTLQAQNRKQSRKIWFIIDELPSLGKLEVLNSALAEARQFGACFVIGVQAISQIRDIYGHDAADSIMALTRTKVIFNPGDPITADICSKFIGHREVDQRSTNFSIGRSEIRDAQSVSSKINQERVMMPEQLTQLPNLAAVIVFPGNFPVCETTFEYKPLDGKERGYIEDPHWQKRVSGRLASIRTVDKVKQPEKSETKSNDEVEQQVKNKIDNQSEEVSTKPKPKVIIQHGDKLIDGIRGSKYIAPQYSNDKRTPAANKKNDHLEQSHQSSSYVHDREDIPDYAYENQEAYDQPDTNPFVVNPEIEISEDETPLNEEEIKALGVKIQTATHSNFDIPKKPKLLGSTKNEPIQSKREDVPQKPIQVPEIEIETEKTNNIKIAIGGPIAKALLVQDRPEEDETANEGGFLLDMHSDASEQKVMGYGSETSRKTGLQNTSLTQPAVKQEDHGESKEEEKGLSV